MTTMELLSDDYLDELGNPDWSAQQAGPIW